MQDNIWEMTEDISWKMMRIAVCKRLDCFIVHSPLPKTKMGFLSAVLCSMCMWEEDVCLCVCVFPHFDLSWEFYPTELQFHSPYAIVIALVQCWFFIRHLFPESPGSFSFIRPSLERQYRASCRRVPADKTSFQSELSDKWAELRSLRGFGKKCCRLPVCLPLSCAHEYVSI